MASMIVQLKLEVPELDLSDVAALLGPEKVAALAEALEVAEAPRPAVDHVRQALAHFAASEVVRPGRRSSSVSRDCSGPRRSKRGTSTWWKALAGPPKACRRMNHALRTLADRVRPTDDDIIFALPMNERVQHFVAVGAPRLARP
jgi:hypothetical protein